MKKWFYVVFLLVILFAISACAPLLNNPPNKPSNPYPANGGASNVPLNVTLKWEASDPDGDTLKFDLYFGEDTNPLLKESNLTTKSYGPLQLEDGKHTIGKL